MTTQETPKQVLDKLGRFIDQQETARASAQALAEQWQQKADAQREELEKLAQKCADLEVWRDQPERARRITQLMEAIVKLEQERDVAEARRAAAAADAATSVRLMETAQDQRESAMVQIRDAHAALNRAGIESAPHEPHEGCSTQLGHRIRLLVAHVERDERLNDELSAELMRANDELTQLERHNQNLLSIIGAETPIGAFDLATTWRAEKQAYMEQIEKLTLALDEQAAQIGVAERMARYLGWAFEQKLIIPNETKELLTVTLLDWARVSSPAPAQSEETQAGVAAARGGEGG